VLARAAVLPVAAVLAVLLLVAGCTDGAPARSASAPGASGGGTPAPRLGGRLPRATPAPRQAMDRLERPVALRLARQVAHEGLTLSYLDCPRWDGKVPSAMTCRGYLDGLVGVVRVDLRAAVRGRAVSFDARLVHGVIATRVLERTLAGQGRTRADCGDAAAYPAHVGDRIVCRVTRGAVSRYVVATVADRAGEVTIAAYPGAGGTG
jgi:hypothetical protein